MPSKRVVVEADENDGDIVTANRPLQDGDEVAVRKVAAAIKKQTERHNWQTSEYHQELSPEDMYVNPDEDDDEQKPKDITIEELKIFEKYVPFSEMGVHTITSVKIKRILVEEVADFEDLV